MAHLLQSVFLAVPVLAYPSQQDKADQASCLAGAPADEEVEEACALQSQVVKRHAFAASQKAVETCEIGDHVECPGSPGRMCAGNQCCPGIDGAGTFPCPSADPAVDSDCVIEEHTHSCLEPRACCRGMTAKCLACSADQTEEEYCAEHPETAGCPAKPCCKAQTAECLACAAHQTEEEHCAEHPETAGCPKICCKAMTAECLACAADQTEEEYCAEQPDAVGCPFAVKACCKAMTAECLACAADQTEEEYCAKHPATNGCAGLHGKPVPYLVQLKSTCAIGDHVECPGTPGRMCAGNQCCPGIAGAGTFPCPSADPAVDSDCVIEEHTHSCLEPRACCRGMTAKCLACSADQTEEEYCAEHPETAGCPAKPCCKALTAECLACAAHQTEEEHCAEHPETAGCPKICCKAMTAECLACAADQTEEEYCAKHPATNGCAGLHGLEWHPGPSPARGAAEAAQR